MDTLEPIMEPVEVTGTMSGTAVIDDLCCRLADRLAKDCNLRASDSYASYSARVKIELWLQDVDVYEVNADLVLGPVESAPPSQSITMGVGAAADQVSGSLPQSLERFIDGADSQVQTAAMKEPRTYVSRVRGAKQRQ